MEGLSPDEVGREIAGHGKHSGAAKGRDRWLSVAEAVLLAAVALVAAWSGYGAAKWSTESRVHLAESSASRAEANRAYVEDIQTKNLDYSAFNAWFSAYVAGNQTAMTLAERRFSPEFQGAFDAWRATSPETNPNAPKGPTYMPEYKQPELDQAGALDAQASQELNDGVSDGGTSDDYILTTLFLASVLFIVGISTQFSGSGVRYGLVGLGTLLLIVSIANLTQLSPPPGL